MAPPREATKLLYVDDETEMADLLTWCLAVRFTHCYQYGEHYLDATGTTLIAPMNTLLSDLPGLEGQFQYWLRDNVGQLLTRLAATPANSSEELKYDTAGTTQNWAPFFAANNANDWRWALGHFSIRMVGAVWIGPADASGDRPVEIQYRSFMFDTYNFGGDEFANLEDLARHGLAAEFLITGESATVTQSSTLHILDPSTLTLKS